MADGRAVALALTADGLIDDCETAAFVVTARNAPPSCGAPVVDRNAARQRGAISVRRSGEAFIVESARPDTYQRPWTQTRTATAIQPARPQRPRDATPRATDLEADDGPSIAAE
jgi:competence protein ComEC